jgi:phage terminase small subunit
MAKAKAAKKKTVKKKTVKKKKLSKKKVNIRKAAAAAKSDMFCLEYLIDFNGTRAYKTVFKCSAATAARGANRLLNDRSVMKYLAKKSQELLNKVEITPEKVLNEIGQISQGNIFDLFDEDMVILPRARMPESAQRRINKIKVEELWEDVFDKDNKFVKQNKVGRILEIDCCSKDKNNAMLMKHLGLFEKDNDQRGEMSLLDIIALMKSKNGSK